MNANVPLPEDFVRAELRRVQAPYCMPRRYGIGTLLVISTLYACLIAGLQGLNAPWQVIVFFCLLLLVIGFCQMLAGARWARAASVIAGVIFMAAFGAIVTVINLPRNPQAWINGTLSGAVGGILIGYLGGALVGGVFLVMDAVERWFDRSGGKSPGTDNE